MEKPVSDTETNGFKPLAREQYVVLTTFRRDGRAVDTPVWLVVRRDGKAYFTTAGDSGKVKRIRNNPRVRLAPSDRAGKVRGPFREGRARVLDRVPGQGADAALRRKYGIQKRLIEVFEMLRRKTSVILEIAPA